MGITISNNCTKPEFGAEFNEQIEYAKCRWEQSKDIKGSHSLTPYIGAVAAAILAYYIIGGQQQKIAQRTEVKLNQDELKDRRLNLTQYDHAYSQLQEGHLHFGANVSTMIRRAELYYPGSNLRRHVNLLLKNLFIEILVFNLANFDNEELVNANEQVALDIQAHFANERQDPIVEKQLAECKANYKSYVRQKADYYRSWTQ